MGTCNHQVDFREWDCEPGTGLVRLYCKKCKAYIESVPLEDVPEQFRDKITNILSNAQKLCNYLNEHPEEGQVIDGGA